MGHPLSLSYITAAELSPPDALDVAAECGCRYVSVRLTSDPPGGDVFPLLSDPALRRETVSRSRMAGVSVYDVEVARLQADTVVARFAPFLDAAAELGAQRVLTTGDDPDAARMAVTFADFCDLAATRGLGADLEFVPWLAVGDLGAALRVVRGAGCANGGILIDALHLDRCGETPDGIAAAPPDLLHYMQICDADAGREPDAESMIRTARHERMLPGEGSLPLTALLRALPPGIVVAMEIPQDTLARHMPARERVGRAVAATRAVLAAAFADS